MLFMDGSHASPLARPSVSLDDRWGDGAAPVLLTGIQALVRVPLLVRALDAAAGLATAGYISGYRGSPLGGYDRALQGQQKRLDAADIVFHTGLNEDLAATAVWGTQQVGLFEKPKFQGVFGIWYGKGPGVDRTGDVFRHANSAGTSPFGGVLALAGDDPQAKSSTVTSGCELTFMDAEMPVLDPADVAEVLEYGVKAIAMSRATGLWVGMKCVADTMDAAVTVVVDPNAYVTHVPPLALPPDGLHIRAPDPAVAQEARIRRWKLPAAIAFCAANGFNRIVANPADATIGIAVRGKAYLALRQAMQDAGLDDTAFRIWKVGMAWPLDRDAARAFADGLDTVLVIEDRRAFLEPQLRDALYDAEKRPRLIGKTDADGAALLSDCGELDPPAILRALGRLLPGHPVLREKIAALDALTALAAPPLHVRDPHYCPGCPHNTSTVKPKDSAGLAGIGCHWLVTKMPRDQVLFSQMGGEGVAWLGIAPFTGVEHAVTNLGDGTFVHSGSLAIRAAIAAKAHITYKVLVNSAVAMTGGQAPDSDASVPRIAAILRAEGIEHIAVVADDPTRHQGDPLMPDAIAFHHRDRLDAVQKELAAIPGVTALIYDQECATERRRHRKRGTAAAADRRVAINPRVCEDCGDCSAVSNCLAVEPVETPWGRKRVIDQSGCNQDMSCVKGFCPSFVTLQGATPAMPAPREPGGPLPAPVLPQHAEPWNILITGIGGQGVTALSAILAMAAHLDGRAVRTMDQTGLAQKGGGVFGMVRIGAPGVTAEAIAGPRIAAGQADLLLASDMVVAHGRTARPLLAPGRTAAVVDQEVAPTAAFVADTSTRYDAEGMLDSLRAVCRDVLALAAHRRVLAELGDGIFLNVMLLGIAWQRGLVPLSEAAILRALELNGAQVGRNIAAFELGRTVALEAPRAAAPAETLDAFIARCADDLRGWGNDRTARDYQTFVARVRAAEGEQTRLTWAVARQLYRLTAYKDEYEVARLHSDPAWRASLAQTFTGTTRIELNLAPPLLAHKNPDTGLPEKRRFGPWMLKAMALLRHGKILRGTVLDPFGRTEERRTEAALAAEYRAGIEALLPLLTPTTHAAICDWAEAAAGIKGFGHIKARNLAAARTRMAAIRATIAR
ncbi:indolepyruvate ferredoxin oxidoreductase family protein [Humitalea sp. 24SJ18S-53]|uniref:indolepyruvate ferredoxin oxidoreductase family protein n=1 Tax=Humitalea sp. 24SJ18S-53 TaxID=3422307 RepID=UPI003D67E697